MQDVIGKTGKGNKVLKISELRERIGDIGKEVFNTHKRYEVELNRLPMFASFIIEGN